MYRQVISSQTLRLDEQITRGGRREEREEREERAEREEREEREERAEREEREERLGPLGLNCVVDQGAHGAHVRGERVQGAHRY